MSNYYISKCCGSQVRLNEVVCDTCLNPCEVTAMLDTPGGVPEKDKTEQIKARLVSQVGGIYCQCGNPINIDRINNFWLQKLEEQKQEIVRMMEDERGKSSDQFVFLALDNVLEKIKKS